MEKLEKIKTEYMLFEEEKLSSVESVFCLLDNYHYEMNYSIKTSKRAIRENNFDYKIEQLKSTFLDFFGYESDRCWIEEDTGYVEEQIKLASVFDGYFGRMCEQLDDDNFLCVSKLAQFAFKKYLDNYNYIESLRDSVCFSLSGITYFGKGESDDKEFGEFFEEIFESVYGKEKEGKCLVKKDN